MAINYADVLGSLKANRDKAEATEGKLPEGQYQVKLKGYKRDKTLKGGYPRWILIVAVVSPGTVYHRAERQIQYIEADNKFSNERMQAFFDMLSTWGIPFNKIKSEDDLRDWMDRVEELRPVFEVDVTDQVDKTTKEHHPKYQNFDIIPESIQQIFEAPMVSTTSKGKVTFNKPEPVEDADADDLAEEAEAEVEEAVEAAPVEAKKTSRPSPFGKK